MKTPSCHVNTLIHSSLSVSPARNTRSTLSNKVFRPLQTFSLEMICVKQLLPKEEQNRPRTQLDKAYLPNPVDRCSSSSPPSDVRVPASCVELRASSPARFLSTARSLFWLCVHQSTLHLYSALPCLPNARDPTSKNTDGTSDGQPLSGFQAQPPCCLLLLLRLLLIFQDCPRA